MRDLSELQELVLETASTLCGFVSQQLRAVKVDVDEQSKTIYFWCYWDGELSESDEDKLDLVAQMAIKSVKFDFPPPYNVVRRFHRLDYPLQLPVDGYFVYLRDESIFDEKKSVPLQVSADYYFNNGFNEADNLNLLSVFALLGKVRPNLRYFWVDIDEFNRLAYFSFYFDGAILAEDKEIAQGVVANAMSHFYHGYSAKVDIERIDFPQSLPSLGIAVYKRDESGLQDEDKTYLEYSEKEWINIETLVPVLYNKQFVSPNNLLSRIRRALAGEIRANVRSIQISINQLKRMVTIWFHHNDEILEGNLEVAEFVRKIVINARYNVTVYTERLDIPATIPSLGYFIFKRDESPYGIPQSVEDRKIAVYKELKAFINEEVASLWAPRLDERATYLRAIKIAASDFEKSLFLLFVFNKSFSAGDDSKAKELVQKVESKFFPGYAHEGYMACYDFAEKIPSIGHIAYLCPGENMADLDLKEWFLLSVAEALIGRVREHLRAVKVELDEFKKLAYFWFYFTGELSDYDRDFTRVIADTSCPPGYKRDIAIQRLDYPIPIPTIGCVIYRRHEL